jgi:hypothetical protein
MLIIAIGINDSQFENSQGAKGVSLNCFRENLIALIALAKNFSDTIVFMGLTSVDEDVVQKVWNDGKYYDNTTIAKYDSSISTVR